MYRTVEIKDECISKTFGYGFVNGKKFALQVSGSYFIEVLFPTPEWESNRVVRGFYDIEGRLLGCDTDASQLLPKNVELNCLDAKFLLNGVRHVMFEKLYSRC